MKKSRVQGFYNTDGLHSQIAKTNRATEFETGLLTQGFPDIVMYWSSYLELRSTR